jgi:hypothetical protein
MTTTTGEQMSSEANTAGSIVRATLLACAGSIVALMLLPLYVAVGAPIAGWALGFLLVAGNKLVSSLIAWLVRDASPTVVLGAVGFSMIGRAMVSALILVLVGATFDGASGDRSIGLGEPAIARAAIIVFLIGFTVDLGIETIRRAADRERDLATMHAATPRETTV